MGTFTFVLQHYFRARNVGVFLCIIRDSSTSSLNIADSSSTLVFWCRQRCAVLFLSLFHPLFFMESVHMENSQSAEKGSTLHWLVRLYHSSILASPLYCCLSFWGFFLRLILSLFCSGLHLLCSVSKSYSIARFSHWLLYFYAYFGSWWILRENSAR